VHYDVTLVKLRSSKRFPRARGGGGMHSEAQR